MEAESWQGLRGCGLIAGAEGLWSWGAGDYGGPSWTEMDGTLV